jgi:hypothetical protein
VFWWLVVLIRMVVVVTQTSLSIKSDARCLQHCMLLITIYYLTSQILHNMHHTNGKLIRTAISEH